MNEYGIGAIEALAWTLKKLKTCETFEQVKDVICKIQNAFTTLTEETAQNFNQKLEALETVKENYKP